LKISSHLSDAILNFIDFDRREHSDAESNYNLLQNVTSTLIETMGDIFNDSHMMASAASMAHLASTTPINTAASSSMSSSTSMLIFDSQQQHVFSLYRQVVETVAISATTKFYEAEAQHYLDDGTQLSAYVSHMRRLITEEDRRIYLLKRTRRKIVHEALRIIVLDRIALVLADLENWIANDQIQG